MRKYVEYNWRNIVPRLTNAEYLKRHCFMQTLYGDELLASIILGHLDPYKQQVLHYYYATAEASKTDDELIEHRRWCDQNTTLSAGKAFSRLLKMTIHLMKMTSIECDYTNTAAIAKKMPELRRYISKINAEYYGRKVPYDSKTRVVPVVRPEVDTAKLASAVMMIAKRMVCDPEYEASVKKIVSKRVKK